MIDDTLVTKCRSKLIEIAKAQGRITYGDLAKHLGIANQSIGRYLNAVYDEEMAAKRPDVTIVVVSAVTGLGRYNSRGGPAQTVKIVPNNPEHVKAYNDELAKVHEHWSREKGS